MRRAVGRDVKDGGEESEEEEEVVKGREARGRGWVGASRTSA